MDVDEDVVRRVLEERGARPGDALVLTITGPQFGRPAGSLEPVSVLPSVFTRLHTMSDGELRLLVCRTWEVPETPGHVLYLFPAEWYERIPNGFEVVTISGQRVKFCRPQATRHAGRARFERGKTSNDRRFGVLGYGVLKALGEVSSG